MLANEGKLDGFVQEREKRFLLLFLAANAFAKMTAERAEFQEFAAAPPQAVDACIAENFPAVGALVRSMRLRMPRAN